MKHIQIPFVGTFKAIDVTAITMLSSYMEQKPLAKIVVNKDDDTIQMYKWFNHPTDDKHLVLIHWYMTQTKHGFLLKAIYCVDKASISTLNPERPLKSFSNLIKSIVKP